MPDVYPAVIAVMATAFRALGLRITVTGDDQVPTHGPAVLASNHSGYPDFTLLGLAARRSRRHVRFLARYDVWQHRSPGRSCARCGTSRSTAQRQLARS